MDPLYKGANSLYIVSGYASATMASRHISAILDEDLNCKISLIIGMCPTDGLEKNAHEGFLNLTESYSRGIEFECKYVYEPPAIHSKVYAWYNDNNPVCAFVGSANYTQPAFWDKNRGEALSECSAMDAYKYYGQLEPSTVYCNHSEVEEYITLTNQGYTNKTEETDGDYFISNNSDNTVTLSLLQRGGEVGERSGLNWGQRAGREPNQAYIPLPIKIARTGFFPLNKQHFTVNTDDRKSLILRVQQENDKAITTPLNNSLIGEYFRNRMDLPNGQRVTRKDLEDYGRTNVTFIKIDEETFYMDFSVNKNNTTK